MFQPNKPITGSVQPKDGKLYAVINLYVDGKRKPKWIDTGFKERNGKRQAKSILTQLLNEYNLKAETEYAQEQKRLRRESEQRAVLIKADGDMPFVEFLRVWLPTKLLGSDPISKGTYASYERLIEGRIARYFGCENEVLLSELEDEDFEDFYASIVRDGKTSATALHYHYLMHDALKYATKKRIVRYNVLDSVDAPGKSIYEATVLTSDEVVDVLRCIEGDPIYMAVLLGAFYGLRRSEVLGLRWDAIDFQKKIIHIRRKVIVVKGRGCSELIDTDVMKTKKSRRDLTLEPFIEGKLLQSWEKQAKYRSLFSNDPKYNKGEAGHICANPLGHLLKPDYITNHFRYLLEKHGLRRVRFHDLRHTCATLLAEENMEMIGIMLLLGHSSSKMTEKYIEKAKANHQNQKVTAKMSQLLSYADDKEQKSKNDEGVDVAKTYSQLDVGQQKVVLDLLNMLCSNA